MRFIYTTGDFQLRFKPSPSESKVVEIGGDGEEESDRRVGEDGGDDGRVQEFRISRG